MRWLAEFDSPFSESSVSSVNTRAFANTPEQMPGVIPTWWRRTTAMIIM